MQSGILYASLAYAMWGLLPLYLKSLQGVAAVEVLLHRMAWSLLFVGAILLVRRQWAWLKPALANRRILLGFAASATVLSLNWFLYIWAVHAGRVVDASLGYFINPLVSVMLGLLVLKERLRLGQWLAVAIAATGVLWLTVSVGQLPWIALVLALTFGTYGLLRKTAALGAIEGLALETALLFPLAISALLWLAFNGQSAFVEGTLQQRILLALAGPVTAIPLILFATGARKIPLSLLGLLQYTGPTLQLLLGVFVYHEPFGWAKMMGFALIWSALGVYSLEAFWWSRQHRT